jgi:uncharacterized repeat protein (TIGR01451 family)
MKNLILLSFLFVGSFKLSAQVQELWMSVDTSYCGESTVYLSFYVGEIGEENPQVTVYWGDGTSDIISTGNYGANSYSFLTATHNYNVSGTFSVYSTFLSSVNSQLITSSTLVFNFYGVNMCGMLYPWAYQNMNCGLQGNWSYNAVYDVKDVNGVISTFTGYMNGVDVTAIPLRISLNDAWLIQNNMIQLSSDIVITSFDSNGYPTNNLSFQIGTLNQTDIPDYEFGYAYAYGLSPLEEFRVWLALGNQTCSTNGTVRVSVTFPSELVPYTSSLTNPLVDGNVLSFDVNESYYYYHTWLTFYMPGTTLAGTEMSLSASVTDLSSTEIVTSNNTINFTGIVYNSYDPNNKLVNRDEYINPNEQEELIYTINFQNEGNYDAINVKVIDTISQNLDLSTFKVLESKHNLVTFLDEQSRVIEFRFTNVNLAPKDQDEEGSKGFVTYIIREKANLPIDSEIENTAYIYFDFNPAIITNTTYNKNTLLSVSKIENVDFQIYPNPVQNKLNFESKSITNELILRDLNGKIILKQQTGFKGQIDVSQMENGIYYLQIINDNTNSIQKVSINKL